MSIYASNPINGHKQPISDLSWLWCLLFGAFFFAFKGVWKHFVIGGILAFITFGVSWLIYPFFARKIIINSYLERGWSVEGIEALQKTETASLSKTTEPLNAAGSRVQESQLNSRIGLILCWILIAAAIMATLGPAKYLYKDIGAHLYAFNFSGFAIFPLAHWLGGMFFGWFWIDDRLLAVRITIGVGYIGLALAIGIIFYFLFQFVKKKTKQE